MYRHPTISSNSRKKLNLWWHSFLNSACIHRVHWKAAKTRFYWCSCWEWFHKLTKSRNISWSCSGSFFSVLFATKKHWGTYCHIESLSLVLDSFRVCVFGASHVLVCDKFRRLCLVMYPQQCSLLFFVTPCQTNLNRCRLDLKLKVFGNNIQNL